MTRVEHVRGAARRDGVVSPAAEVFGRADGQIWIGGTITSWAESGLPGGARPDLVPSAPSATPDR